MRFVRFAHMFLLSLVSTAFVSAIEANERFMVVSRSNTAESVLFFGTASLLFLVLFVFIHWGVRKH